jgi:hypothetical protein
MSDSDEIDRFDSGADDTDIGEQETPLREIAKAIERLEKAGVPCPMSCGPRRRELPLASLFMRMQRRL